MSTARGRQHKHADPAGQMGHVPRAVNRLGRFLMPMVAMLVLLGAVEAKPADAAIKIVAYGDSLTAGYGLKPSAAFPVQLEKALRAKGHDVEVINAGVSGDTTAAALDRFDWAVPGDADAAIVELGANDALRGLEPGKARSNLDAIIKRLKARNVEVLIAGMSAPRNLGPAYVESFDSIFRDLAKKHDAELYPFFLDGVALKPKLNQSDGIHPTAAGVAVIVERMLPAVEALIERTKSRRAAKSR